jgi:hypothetical protein
LMEADPEGRRLVPGVVPLPRLLPPDFAGGIMVTFPFKICRGFDYVQASLINLRPREVEDNFLIRLCDGFESSRLKSSKQFHVFLHLLLWPFGY